VTTSVTVCQQNDGTSELFALEGHKELTSVGCEGLGGVDALASCDTTDLVGVEVGLLQKLRTTSGLGVVVTKT
jgi:hypothetical protein